MPRQFVKIQDEDNVAIAKVEMMPYYLSPADSEKNEEWMFETMQKIADSLK